ncbi:MAG: accessory gene regulator ArgB-like protein [Bacillota bacterium]
MFDIANRMAVYLSRETGLDQSRTDRVRFGLELLLGEIIKFALLLAGAAVLGLLPETMAAMAGFSLFRLFSGGAHCEDYWRCLVFSLVAYLGASFASVLVAPYITKTIMTVLVIAGTTGIVLLVLLWAPGEVPQRKIKQSERGLLKGLSIVFLLIWAGVLIFVLSPYSISVMLAGFLGTVVQAFSFTPPGYRAINIFDIVLSKKIGERRCSTHAENA